MSDSESAEDQTQYYTPSSGVDGSRSWGCPGCAHPRSLCPTRRDKFGVPENAQVIEGGMFGCIEGQFQSDENS
jgi:hypothetical protein